MISILALETSSDTASVALWRAGSIESLSTQGTSTHSQHVLPMVQTLLRQAGITLSACDAIAFGCGPGAFTGVRTACGIAQGLAFGADKPVIPIVSLLAMAQSCRNRSGADEVLALLDARMREVYWAQYRFEEGQWISITEPTLSAPTQVQPVENPLYCGNGLDAYPEAFAQPIEQGKIETAIVPHAVAVAELGHAAWLRGEVLDAAEAQPLYLRNKVADTIAERLAKKTGWQAE